MRLALPAALFFSAKGKPYGKICIKKNSFSIYDNLYYTVNDVYTH